MRLLRFIVPERDDRTGQPTGLIALAYALLRSDQLGGHDAANLQGQLTWIESNLPVPRRFARKHNVSHRHTHGLSWIKSDARAAVQCLYAIANIVRQHGHAVEILQTSRPGYVVHEDRWQVVAEPFHGEWK